MDKDKHIKILKKGVKAWNKWRQENPHEMPNLTGADLFGANLSLANLSEADLSEADLGAAKLINSNLSRANLGGANLSLADLLESKLTGADLSRANLSGANLSLADLFGANLNMAGLMETNLFGADLFGADLSEASLSEANLLEAKLDNADLQYAGLNDVELNRASLISANLSRADISGAKIDNINMSGWTIKEIKCTHVFLNKKRIDYDDGEFERRYTKIEKIIEMIINVPLSDLTYYTGRIIQEYVNEKYGEGSLVLKGQTALSNNSTKYDFLSFQEEEIFDKIDSKLSEIEKKINPVYEDLMAKQENRDVITIPDQIGLKVVPLEVNMKAINNILIERFNRLSPILQKIILAIQSAF